jgi:nicotinamidase-related amidase
MSHYHKLYTAEDTAVAFIDFQPQMAFGVANIDRTLMMRNVALFARVAKEFGVPTVLTGVDTETFSGYVLPELLDVFPGQPVVERTEINAWDNPEFRRAIEATGRKNIILAGLWTEICVAWPAIAMLGEGYHVYVLDDCCGGSSVAAHEAGLSRMVQAGATRLTALAALFEFQRDWARKEHYDALMNILRQSAGGGFGSGVEYVYTMLYKAPQLAKVPQVVPAAK